MLIKLPGLLEDKTVLVDSREKWERLDAFVRSFFDFQAEALSGLSVPSAPLKTENGLTPSPSPEQGSAGAAGVTNQDFIRGSYESSVAINKQSWPERAWRSLERDATAEEMYAEAARQGYRSTADNPLAAFKRAIRDNPRFVHVDTGENGAKVWRLYNTPQTTTSLVRNESPSVPTHSYIPPAGSQISDYAERALLALAQESATHTDLTQKMLEMGWTTRSPDPAGTVRSRLSQDRRWERIEDGRWRLRKQYSQDSQSHHEPVLDYAETPERVGADSNIAEPF